MTDGRLFLRCGMGISAACAVMASILTAWTPTLALAFLTWLLWNIDAQAGEIDRLTWDLEQSEADRDYWAELSLRSAFKDEQ